MRSRWRDARACCVNASVPCMSRALSLRTSAAVVCSAAAGDARLLRHAAVSSRVRAPSSLRTARAHRLGPHGRDARQLNTTRNREEWCPSGAFRSSYCRGRRWNRRPRERNADDGHRRYDSYREVGTVFVAVARPGPGARVLHWQAWLREARRLPYGGGGRWIEVAPSGSAIAIALVPPSEGRSAGSDEAHCARATEDIEADHATLRARGVDVDHGGLAGATGWCFAGSPGSARRRELAARYPESREEQPCGTCC
jgi:hypothetical protein